MFFKDLVVGNRNSVSTPDTTGATRHKACSNGIVTSNMDNIKMILGSYALYCLLSHRVTSSEDTM